jgi:hypothetical protein
MCRGDRERGFPYMDSWTVRDHRVTTRDRRRSGRWALALSEHFPLDLVSSCRYKQSAPVIGFLGIRSPGEATHLVTAFHPGLQEAGYVEGQNVALNIPLGGESL